MNLPNQLSPKKRAFLAGTLLLTGTGFLCRILGFFYRIYLSRTIGAEGLGIYNMIHPIFGICFALCAGSMQTALSQYIASHTNRGRHIFRTGMIISLTLSFILAMLVANGSEWLAANILMEPRCARYLPLMAYSIPFVALHACINGYYYGIQKTRVPAFSQVVEQVIRMAAVYLVADIWLEMGRPITVQLAVIGHLIGEIGAALFTFCCLCLIPPQPGHIKDDTKAVAQNLSPSYVKRYGNAIGIPLMSLALPLMGNRLVLNVLASAEAIWIPSRLQMSGLSSSEALSAYGVLTGMSLSFVLFPSAITNSLAVLLLPSVAKDQAEGKQDSIAASISMALRYSLYMGILCVGIFILFGNSLGTSVFHDYSAGYYIQVLAWLCPFLYLATTLGSILNGLGKTKTTFIHNVSAMLIRICFVLFVIPRYGILAYLWGLLASETALALLHLWSLRRIVSFPWNAWEMIAKPTLLLLIAIGIYHFFHGVFLLPAWIPVFLQTAFWIMVISCCYGGLLVIFHFGKKSTALPE